MNWESNKTQLKTDWGTNGYVVVKNFMNLKDVSNLRTEIERYMADVDTNTIFIKVTVYDIDSTSCFNQMPEI